MDGLRDRAGAGIDVRAGVHRDRFDPHSQTPPLTFWPWDRTAARGLTMAATVSPKISTAGAPGVDDPTGTYP